MRVLILNQYYHPDIAATAQLAADVGAELARAGHEVTALASARPYAGRGWLPLVDEHAGVRIVRVPATAIGRRTRGGRAVDYASYLAGLGAALAPLCARARPDVVLALSTPPLVAALGLGLRALARTRLVYWVMDVYPDVALALGALAPGGAAARALVSLSRALYRRADALVALDEAMRDRLVAAGADAERVEVIDNWVDGDAIRPASRDGNLLRAELGLGDRFTVSYSGNMGLGHDLDTVVGAIELLQRERIHWLFIGDGPRRSELEARVRAIGAPATFLPYRPRAELPVSLTAADASLVCLADGLAGLVVPSKVYGILAAGVPLVYVGPPAGRAHALTVDGAGVHVANGDSRSLARALVELRDDPARRATLGRAARALFDARYQRPLALARHRAVVERAAC
jgi:glycosyltransferase involved in cell wall biosynthesis